LNESSHTYDLTSCGVYPPTAKVVLVGARHQQVQFTEHVIVVLPLACWIQPLQWSELQPVEPLALRRVVGVDLDPLSLQGRPQPELELKTLKR